MPSITERVADARRRIADQLELQRIYPSFVLSGFSGANVCNTACNQWCQLLMIADEALESELERHHNDYQTATANLTRWLTRLARVGLATEASDD